MNWRIYRLPGSREIWHIDGGSGTPVINVRGYNCFAASRSVDIGGANVPRAWIEVNGRESELHIVDGIAHFDVVCLDGELNELMESTMQVIDKVIDATEKKADKLSGSEK